MSLYDFHFSAFEKSFEGRRFADNSEICPSIEECFLMQPETFFKAGIHTRVKQ